MRLQGPLSGAMTPRTWAAIEEKWIDGDNNCSADVEKLPTNMIFINTSHLVNRN